jgi:hypothetical protein
MTPEINSPFAAPPIEEAEFTEEATDFGTTHVSEKDIPKQDGDFEQFENNFEKQPEGDDLGIGNLITPEDIKAGKTTLSPEQMEQLKLKMKTDFSGSSDFLTKAKWNQRYHDAKQKMDNCTSREFIESADIKRQTEIYLKGKHVKKLEGTDQWVEV